MHKTRAFGKRAQRSQAEAAASRGVTAGVSFWLCCGVAGSVWTVVFYLSTMQLEIGSPSDRDLQKDCEKVLRPWRYRVRDLEATVKRMQQELQDANETIADLRGKSRAWSPQALTHQSSGTAELQDPAHQSSGAACEKFKWTEAGIADAGASEWLGNPRAGDEVPEYLITKWKETGDWELCLQKGCVECQESPCLTTTGSNCKFPFKYRGTTYNACAKFSKGEDARPDFKCALTTDSAGTARLWGDCSPTCFQVGNGAHDGSESTALVDTTPASDQNDVAPATSPQSQDPTSLATPQNRCYIQNDIDYLPDGKEDILKSEDGKVLQHVSSEKCCQACWKMNEAHPGSCAVGVVSSMADHPPEACWLKELVSKSVAKTGVKACWPPGHPPIPASPEEEKRRHAERSDAEVKALAPLSVDEGHTPDVDILRRRADAIRKAGRHAWSNYRRYAWGKDELKPLSGKGVNKQFSHAVTMVDALDTLWIMGLRDEFAEAKEWLRANFISKVQHIPGGASVFETTIRSLGGLLSAYDLSKDEVFLNLAIALGTKIKGKVNDKGITPYTFSGASGSSRCHSLAESGTSQLEMRYLSHVTGDPSFSEKVDRFYDTVLKKPNLDGLYPNCFEAGRGKITFGADGDSFYEYLIKVWIQGGRKDPKLWNMYDKAVEGLEQHLIREGAQDGEMFMSVLKWNGNQNKDNHGSSFGVEDPEMEHLTCFVPGWLALGMHDLQDTERRDRIMKLAANLANTCWQMYRRQPTGIGPERVKGMKLDLSKTDTREYILRPEAIEGWWYMFELTKDPKYREWGWSVFLSFEKYLKVEKGYASLKDVTSTNGKLIDRMESFFLAETLKYLYLLQDPDHTIHLDRYVFNTEAHPLSLLSHAPVRIRPSAGDSASKS